jgi:hypothetical protein
MSYAMATVVGSVDRATELEYQLDEAQSQRDELLDIVRGMLFQWDGHNILMGLLLADARAAVVRIKRSDESEVPARWKTHGETP